MDKSAEFSECGKYRYQLVRIWDRDKPTVMCIGLNPSTANDEKNDATINWLINSLTHLGYGGLKMMNLYSYITPYPKELQMAPMYPGVNDQWILTTAANSQAIVFCWGAFKGLEYHAKKWAKIFPQAKCFGKNKNGSPWHPLALFRKGIKASEAQLSPFL